MTSAMMTVTFDFDDAILFAEAFTKGLSQRGWPCARIGASVMVDVENTQGKDFCGQLRRLSDDVAAWAKANRRDWDVSVLLKGVARQCS